MTSIPSVPHDPDELIAVVDEQDRMIGTTTRHVPGVGHAGGKRHREAAVILRNPAGDFLLQDRDGDRGIGYSASGHFAPSETYLDGAIREAREELGVDLPREQFAEVLKRRQEFSGPFESKKFVTVFEVRGDYPLSKFNIDTREVRGIRYYPKEELARLLKNHSEKFSKGVAEVLSELLKRPE